MRVSAAAGNAVVDSTLQLPRGSNFVIRPRDIR